ncbi:hypothetical protein DKG71_14510 [Streptomyces sp. NEAU-S7GS2]|nr:hypothetical protein DKG71_14510 [Streptomyces sp. NEAU-S7GS2]
MPACTRLLGIPEYDGALTSPRAFPAGAGAPGARRPDPGAGRAGRAGPGSAAAQAGRRKPIVGTARASGAGR